VHSREFLLVSAFSIYLIYPFNYLLPREYCVYYPYDTLSGALWGLALSLLYRQRLGWYYLVFVLATLNRETSCFLTIIYLLTSYKKDNAWRVLRHICLQAMIWIILKLWLAWQFAGNPGSFIYEPHHFYTNLVFLADPKVWPILLSNFGYIWLPVLVGYKYIKDDFIRRSLGVMPLFLLGMIVVGNLPEIRTFGEMMPVVLAAFICLVFCRNSINGCETMG
jgi:hypothetical protein